MPDFNGVPIVAAQATLARVGLKGPPPTFVDVHIPDVGGANTAPKPPVAPGSVVATTTSGRRARRPEHAGKADRREVGAPIVSRRRI